MTKAVGRIATPRPCHGGLSVRALARSLAALPMVLGMLLTGCEALLAGCERQFPRDLEAKLGRVADESLVQQIAGDPAYVRADSVISVEFSSATDWVRAAASKSASLYLDGFFCELEDRVVLLTAPSLFVNGKRAARTMEDGTANLPQPGADGRYVVKGFLWLRDGGGIEVHENFRSDPNQEYYDSFDLAKDPRDVCLFVGGGTMWLPLFDYRSNVAVVPKEEIATVLARGPGSVGARRERRID